ncbi:hypothetical protein [Streptomyces sp. RFCAC02]|uniref:hypothetical protein n=1 Tax=Streptomyces sp. RFCAC02 TaxID=2499143 RepID=UPI001F0F4D99|nr:hypothetical protein [Streptomyces sp. RFCAC02]
MTQPRGHGDRAAPDPCPARRPGTGLFTGLWPSRSAPEEHRQRWMELMTRAVEDVLPDDDLLRRRVVEYFDWGTRIARDVSGDPVGTDLGTPGPTPRWGWDGLV